MSRHFRPWTIDQTQLLPAAVVDYVPADHLAQLVVALAREHLDLSEIVASYKSGLGQPPFDPRMMTALLLYAYCSGLYSSRRIAKACAERVDFMMIVAHDAPDFRTIADFRKRHLPALGRLFLQVLKLAEKAGLGEAGGMSALDGTKIKQGERLQTQGDELRTHEDTREQRSFAPKWDRWLEAAEAADAPRGQTPRRKPSRRRRKCPTGSPTNRSAWPKSARPDRRFEAEAAAAAAAKAEAERAAEEKTQGREPQALGAGSSPALKRAHSDPKVQRNFTDPDSRVLLTKDGFIQGYNAQAAVDGAKQPSWRMD